MTDGSSPEPPLQQQQQQTTSISGGLFSEVSKKLGWNKDGADIAQTPPPGYFSYIYSPFRINFYGQGLLEDRVLHKEAWVAKLLGTHLSIQVNEKGQIFMTSQLVIGS